jgi:hypothetical protein
MEEKSMLTLREAICRHCKPSAVANIFIKALLSEGYSKTEIQKITHTMETLTLGDEIKNGDEECS